MSELALPEPTPENHKQLMAKPSDLVPAAVKPALFECWMAHRTMHELKATYAPIATVINIWIRKHGLHPDDASRILFHMQSPEEYGKHQYCHDFLSALGRFAAVAIAERKKDEEAERQRQAEKQAAESPPTDEQRQAIRELITVLGVQRG